MHDVFQRNRKREPIVFGLLGGVASGKSTIAQMMEELGAQVIDADKVGHEALRDPEVRSKLVEYFSSVILAKDSEIDRRILAVHAFDTPEALEFLTTTTHPWIRQTIKDRLQEALEEKEVPAVVLDISLLLEAGAYNNVVDCLIFVDTNLHVRAKRAKQYRGWADEEVERRQQHQLPLSKKRALADEVVTNDGDAMHLQRQVVDIWESYVGGKQADEKPGASSGS